MIRRLLFGLLAGVVFLTSACADARQRHRDRGGRNGGAPGDMTEAALDSGGLERSYLVYVPPSVAPQQPVPLVLVFHGGGGRAKGIARTTAFNDLAAREGFIVVYPNGTGWGRGGTWNAGGNPPQGYAEKQNVDDVGFVRDILADVSSRHAIDRDRIFATGLSKGGMLTYRLACEMADVFAAVAAVAATMTASDCSPTSPVSVLAIHGTDDQNVPFGGGAGELSRRGADYPPAMRGLELWASTDHCRMPARQISTGVDSICHAFAGCGAGDTVEYCLIEGGGHAWPGSEPKGWQRRRGVHVSQAFPATQVIWDFFEQHPK